MYIYGKEFCDMTSTAYDKKVKNRNQSWDSGLLNSPDFLNKIE
jgi:hypothetical protein